MGLAAVLPLLAQMSAQAAQALAACYLNVYPVGHGAPLPGLDPDFFVREECCDTSPQAVTGVLGPGGLPVYAGPDRVAFPINDLNERGEITWWSPAFNPRVHYAGYGEVPLPFSSEAMYPPRGQNPAGNDVSVRLTAVFSGSFQLTASAPVTFSIGSDDDAFLYVDGMLVIAEEGVHVNSRVNATSGLLAAGTHRLVLFYADRQPAGASLSFAVVSPQNLSIIPLEAGLVDRGRCDKEFPIPADAQRPPRRPWPRPAPYRDP